MISLSLNNSQIIIMVSVIVAIIFLLVIIFLILFFHRNNKNKILTKIDNMLNSVKDLNKEQINSYLTRLKNISSKNESYVEIYNQINAAYIHLTETEFEKLTLRENGLKDRINNEKKIKKKLFEQIKSFEKAINVYKKEIKGIQTDLENYFKDGDELRVQSTDLSNKFMHVKQDMAKYDQSLNICKNELKSYITDISMLFDQLEDNISSAYYSEAHNKVKEIDAYLANIYDRVELIAQYCKLVEEIIPQELQELKNKNDDLAAKGYVVSYAKVDEFISNTNEVLESCKTEFKLLRFGDFEDVYNEIQNKLADVNAHLDSEVSAKDNLDIQYKIVSEKTKNAEAEALKINRDYKIMVEYYVLPQDVIDQFQEFSKDAVKLSDLSREYQSYQFANTKIQASFMLRKVQAMDELANKNLDNINYFTNYFNGLKSYVDDTFNQSRDLCIKLTKIVGQLRLNKCKDVYLRYIDNINEKINDFKKVKQILTTKPIQLNYLYTNFSKLVSSTNDLMVAIKNDFDNRQLLKKSIIFANPLRYKINEVDALLNEIEILFKNGEYKLGQEKVNYILNNYHPSAFSSLKDN